MITIMRLFADLHVHSKYARAVSKEMTLENIAKWAGVKGIGLVGTGDFTHPMWFREIREKLEESEPGLFQLKRQYRPRTHPNNNGNHHARYLRSHDRPDPRFLLTAEISCIYSKGGKVRRVHHILVLPSLKAVQEVSTRLSWVGNLRSDGRPIIGMDSQELLKIVLTVAPTALLIPAHAWTPHFGIFGSGSGFDSLEECFGDLTGRVLAIETGLSSDPAMNWRLTKLDRIAILSFSDAHSLPKLGREAVLFDIEPSYQTFYDAITSRDPSQLLMTVEFFPEEGKYHYDGHRVCGVRLAPQERIELGNACPTCGRSFTVGVLSRVEALADRPVGEKPAGAIPFRNIIPLNEIISASLGTGTGTKGVMQRYSKLVGEFGSEFSILLDIPRRDLELAAGSEIAEGIIRVRDGRVSIEPGYDGVYGKIHIFGDEERASIGQKAEVVTQQSLF